MSGRVRKQSDCPVGKQGPMRATLPVSSVMKQSGGLKKNSGNSPTLSPTNVWRRISPDHALSGQRSPGAVNYKGKGRFGSSVIRRTASLDTLYHKGQWSRDYYLHAGQLQVDKSTQTDEGGGASGRSSRGSDDDKLDRFLRSRLQRPHKPSASGDFSGHAMSPGFWSRFGSGSVPLRAARSSVEGLNQEIERLVLYPASGTQTPHIDRLRDKVTPEGHRAPLAELFRRSVNTQTPHDLCHTAHSSDPPSRGSLSSDGSAELLAAGGSVCSSPDMDGSKLGTSPQINRFLAREPPDGCEKVISSLKMLLDGHYQRANANESSQCLGQTTVSKYLHQFVTAVNERLKPRWITFPSNTKERHQIAQTFLSKSGVPNILGVIDCTQVKILPPNGVISSHFKNSHGDMAINVQLVNLKAGEGCVEPVSVMKPAVAGFTLRPSLGSAFQPLQPAPSPPSPH